MELPTTYHELFEYCKRHQDDKKAFDKLSSANYLIDYVNNAPGGRGEAMRHMFINKNVIVTDNANAHMSAFQTYLPEFHRLQQAFLRKYGERRKQKQAFPSGQTKSQHPFLMWKADYLQKSHRLQVK